MKIWNTFIIVAVLYALYGCADRNVDGKLEGKIVDFGNPKQFSASDIIDNCVYVKLDDSELSLVGEISQLESFQDRIYILDTYKAGAIFVFSKTGFYCLSWRKKEMDLENLFHLILLK